MPTKRKGRPRGKIALLALIWSAQALIAMMLLLLWLSQGGSVEANAPLGTFDLSVIVEIVVNLEFWLWFSFCFVMLSILQGVFVLPVRRPTAAKHRGLSVWLSLAIAAAFMVMLTLAFVLTLGTALSLAIGEGADDWTMSLAVFLSLLAVNWAIYTVLLIRFCRAQSRETLLSRIASRLFLGTLIEAAAIIPLDVMIRRRTDCYCGEGTFFALGLCGVVGFFVAGPAVFLPIIMKRRKRWYEGRCDACGYDMSGCPNVDRCPECGAGWRAPNAIQT